MMSYGIAGGLEAVARGRASGTVRHMIYIYVYVYILSDIYYIYKQVDWRLWQEGERRALAGDLPPHHRTHTTFY